MKCLPPRICVIAAKAAKFPSGTETRRDRTQPAWLMARFRALKPFMPAQGVLISKIFGLHSSRYRRN